MAMHSSDWAKLWAPLATELLKEIFRLIFGGKQKREHIVEQYLSEGGKNERLKKVVAIKNRNYTYSGVSGSTSDNITNNRSG